MIEEKLDVACINCGGFAYVKWDHKYNGYRGFCPACGVNWPES